MRLFLALAVMAAAALAAPLPPVDDAEYIEFPSTPSKSFAAELGSVQERKDESYELLQLPYILIKPTAV